MRPRGGGKGSPPLVTESKIFSIPFFGVISEFLKSPNDMMTRCVEDYGPVFTIPVSLAEARLRKKRIVIPSCPWFHLTLLPPTQTVVSQAHDLFDWTGGAVIVLQVER